MLKDKNLKILPLPDEWVEMEPASPLPWTSHRDGNQYIDTKYIPTAKCVGASVVVGPPRPWNPHALLAFGFLPEENEKARFIDADADYIVAACNERPAMLAEITRLRAEVKRLIGLK